MSKAKGKGKGKAGTTEPTKVATTPPAGDDSEEAQHLRKCLRIMKADLTNEKSHLNDFQQQQEKIRQFWDLEKKRLEDMQMTKRRKQRSLEDLAEKHSFELNVYKMKISHVLHEHQSKLTDVRTEAEVFLNKLQNEHRAAEQDLREATWEVKAKSREMEVSHSDLVRMLKHDQERKIMNLRREYQRKAEEMRLSFEDSISTIRKQRSDSRKVEIKRIERTKSEHISHLMSLHKEEFQSIKNYYHDITHNNLDLIKILKEEVLDMKKKEHDDEKAMLEIAQVNKKLSEPLKKHLREVEELRVELRNYERDKIHLQSTKKRIAELDNRLKNLIWEHEVLFQKEEQVSQERDELQRRLDATRFKVQQKSAFKSLLLETKLSALEADIEKKETTLHEVLVSTNLQPELFSDASHRLEDILLQKNETVKELKDRLNSLRSMYHNVIHVYNSRLAEFQVHPADLGFTPQTV